MNFEAMTRANFYWLLASLLSAFPLLAAEDNRSCMSPLESVAKFREPSQEYLDAISVRREGNTQYSVFGNHREAIRVATIWMKDRGFSGSIYYRGLGVITRKQKDFPTEVDIGFVSDKPMKIQISHGPIAPLNDLPRAFVQCTHGDEKSPFFLFPGNREDVRALLRILAQ